MFQNFISLGFEYSDDFRKNFFDYLTKKFINCNTVKMNDYNVAFFDKNVKNQLFEIDKNNKIFWVESSIFKKMINKFNLNDDEIRTFINEWLKKFFKNKKFFIKNDFNVLKFD